MRCTPTLLLVLVVLAVSAASKPIIPIVSDTKKHHEGQHAGHHHGQHASHKTGLQQQHHESAKVGRAIAVAPHGRNIPDYSPTSVILNAKAIDVLLQNIFNVVNAHIKPIVIPNFDSGSGCSNHYGWSSSSIDINNLHSPSITILEDGIQVDMSLDLGITFNVFDNPDFRIIWCIHLNCGGSAHSFGTISLSFKVGMNVANEYLGVNLAAPVVVVPSDFHSSLHLSGFFCFLAQDIGKLFGIHLGTILNDVITGVLSSQAFSNDMTGVINSNVLAYTANGNSNNIGQIRLCALDFDPALSRVMITVPITQSNGGDSYYCSSGKPNAGTPPWGQFSCPLQDLMVIMSLRSYNIFNGNLNGIAQIGQTILGDLIFAAPASVSAILDRSTLQVCATTQTSTLEEFIGISIAFQ